VATKLHIFRKEKQKIKTCSIQKIKFSSSGTFGVISAFSGAFLGISGHIVMTQ